MRRLGPAAGAALLLAGLISGGATAQMRARGPGGPPPPPGPPPAAPATMPADALAPASAWTADFGENSCVLQRDFGDKDKMVLAVQPMPRDPFIQVSVLYHGTGPKAIPFGNATVALYPGGKSMTARFRDNQIAKGDGLNRALIFYVPRAQFRDLADVKVIAFAFGNKVVSLAPTALNAAMSTLQTCEDDLVKSWGYDPAALKALKRGATPVNMMAWFKPTDMPAFGEIKGYAAPANVRFTVGADGAISNCVLLQGSGSPVFDATVCKLVSEKAKYTPAADANDKPAASLEITSVGWIPH